MDLTQEQILEMTETIARACGFHCERIKSHVYRVEMLSGEEESFSIFDPFESWDDAMKADDALEIGPLHFIPKVENMERCWLVGLGHYPYGYQGEHADRLTAFFIALHEVAKYKLEGYQNEDGN